MLRRILRPHCILLPLLHEHLLRHPGQQPASLAARTPLRHHDPRPVHRAVPAQKNYIQIYALSGDLDPTDTLLGHRQCQLPTVPVLSHIFEISGGGQIQLADAD